MLRLAISALLVQVAYAIPHEVELIQLETAIPPGNANLTLLFPYGAPSFRFVSDVIVGFEGVEVPVLFDSTTCKVVMGNFNESIYNPAESVSFVPAPSGGRGCRRNVEDIRQGNRSRGSRQGRDSWIFSNSEDSSSEDSSSSDSHSDRHRHRRRHRRCHHHKCHKSCHRSCNGTCSADVTDFGLNTTTLEGTGGFEYFNISGLILQGQPICVADVPMNVSLNPFVLPVMGFGFSDRKCCCGQNQNFVNNLYKQAQIEHDLISFAVDATAINAPTMGYAYIGDIKEEALAGPLTNYSALPNECTWSFPLTNMVANNITLGVNGKITVDTNSPFSVVPMTTLFTILEALNIQDFGLAPIGDLVAPIFECSSFPINDGPEVTYYLGGEALTLTSSQYILQLFGNTCVLGIAGSSQICPENAAYTLGTASMNQTYVFFDFEERIFGRGPVNTTFLNPIIPE